jgi:cytochrome c biogenesis protein CcdA/thiol-disulfide isomerase/thioredoxin
MTRRHYPQADTARQRVTLGRLAQTCRCARFDAVFAMVILLLLSALVGAGTALSPCALPVLPALLSAGAAGGRRRPLAIVAGLSATFLLSIIGGGELLQHVGLGGSTLRDAGIAVLVVAGLAALVPSLAQRLERPLAALSRLGPRTKGDGFASGLLVGAALGFVYAPCAGPVLAAVVSISAVTGRTVAVAAAYVVGSAAVLAGIALGGRRVLEPIRRAGPLRVQRVLGAILLATAVAFAAGLDMQFETALARHTGDITVTAGLEKSGAVQDRLSDLHHGKPKFDAATSAPKAPRADLPDLGHAPDFVDTQRWFNSAPLSLHALKGRVVLVDFWTYTCINCLRTLPYLEAWDRRYRAQGLTIVGVHAPEFGFEHDAGNVARAIDTNHITYPVVQDNNLSTWKAWGNQYWPAEYLVDAKGEVRETHFGEGDYAKTEAAIRALLAERGAALTGVRAKPKDVTPVGTEATPETYVGAARAQGFVGTPPTRGTHDYAAPAGGPPVNSFALGGTWTIGDEPATAGLHATITASVRARFVYLVLSPPSATRPGAVDVVVDGRPARRVAVAQQRLYTLADFGRTSSHTIALRFARGTSAYAFTFG